jgi:mannose-6-phosphate isomerase class I
VPKIIKDFWALTDNGIVLFSKVYDQKVNPQLFGALMSALNKFAEALSDGGISSFEKSDLRYIIIKRRKFLFIGSSYIKTKEKKVIDELMQISDTFFRIYSKELINWNNDVSIFSDFGVFIDKSLEK